MYFTFSNQSYLFFLFIIPLFVLIYFLSLRSSKRRALRFANFDAISRVKGVDILSKNITASSLSIVILVLLIFALSGLTLHMQAEASSFSFIIAIDSSSSMEATDIPPTRIEAAKQVSKSFIASSPPTTKIGVISFSGNTFVYLPLTTNKGKAIAAVDAVQLSKIDGTDVYESVVTSSNLLIGEDSRAIIFLSDGQINVGDTDSAISYAKANNILIHSLAIGTAEGGATSFGISKLDEDALKALSYNTGGEFFKVTDQASLQSAFERILKVTKKNVAVELFPYLIIASIILFFLEYALWNLKYRVFP